MISRDVFACKCGCGFNEIKDSVVQLVDVIHSIAPECTVTSGCRCPEHNESEGGKADSPHLRGLAADLYCPNSKLRYLVLRKLFALGIKRIGIGKDFIHLDIDPERTSWVGWLY
jgi:uncharacterized protein YcbK (DUF882 family)